MSILDTLTTDQESLVIDAIEGELRPEYEPMLKQLLATNPGLDVEIARLTQTRSQMRALEVTIEPNAGFVPQVMARLEEATAPLQLRHMDAPVRSHRSWIPASAARPLAAAAAVLIIAALGFSFFGDGSNNTTTTPGPLADNSPDDLPIAPHDFIPQTPEAIAVAQAEAESRSFEAAERVWTEVAEAEPTLAEAVELLAAGRLVIRGLAPQPDIARAGAASIAQGLDSQSNAWAFVNPLNRASMARFEPQLTDSPVFAVDEPTGLRVQLPQPRTVSAWSAEIAIDAPALASIVHNLRELGLRVRFEAIETPFASQPDLESAIWWDESPESWRSTSMAPVIIDALDRP